MRIYCEDRGLRVFMADQEVAWAYLRLRGLKAEVEFPSDWFEHRAGHVHLGLGFLSIGFAFPWPWTVPDEDQCSGPIFGFTFFEDSLHVNWGKRRGLKSDPYAVIRMPWAWRYVSHRKLTKPESHPFVYTLRNGEVQHRTATIDSAEWRWWRPWLPYKLVERNIDILFNEGVGERVTTWKGGVSGCSYRMHPGETPLDTLRRMELECKFN